MRKKKKIPALMDISYDDRNRADIDRRVAETIDEFPELTLSQARIYEIIARLQGDNGLSRHNVSYLVSCILDVLGDSDSECPNCADEAHDAAMWEALWGENGKFREKKE